MDRNSPKTSLISILAIAALYSGLMVVQFSYLEQPLPFQDYWSIR
jgi:hypothetical protein